MLNDLNIRTCFEEKQVKLVDVGILYSWGLYEDGVFKSGDELCGEKGGRGREIPGGEMNSCKRQC